MSIFETETRVGYYDTDAMQVVYHANYIKYFELGRTSFLREIGYPYKRLEEMGLMLPIISCKCEFKKPAVYDDLLTIKCWLHELKGARVVVRYEIYHKERTELLVTGETEMATVDRLMRPINLKRKMPEFYQVLLGTQ